MCIAVIGEKESDFDKQIIQHLEQAFANITEATGNNDIDTIVHTFITKEDQIFALYNYVSISCVAAAGNTVVVAAALHDDGGGDDDVKV